MKTLVKVCGMTRPEQAEALDSLGVDLLGFIFAAKSPRRVSPEQAAAMPRGRAKRVGVFVEQTVGEVLAIMERADLDLAQLHGGQSPGFCRAVGPERVIRVFWPTRHPDLETLNAEMAGYADVCSMVLLDAGTSGGGHGKSLDFAPLSTLVAPRPWILAGGLSPDNLAEALRLARPAGVDMNSGLETSPGIKDIDKVRQALQRIELTQNF